MNNTESTFVSIIKHCINNEINDDLVLSDAEIQSLLILSQKQNMLPMVFDWLSKTKLLLSLNKDTVNIWQKNAMTYITREIIQTNEFLNIILQLQQKGYDPVVVKGIAIRNLYPIPLVRISVDEDIFVKECEIDFYHNYLLSKGLTFDKDSINYDNEYEFSYHKKDSPTYIEVHKRLFDPKADGYSNLNNFFREDVFKRTENILVDDVYVRTLSCTDHLLFLILHAYKHFIYSGVGLRAICDIGVFANHYYDRIDWKYIRECLEKANVFYYSKALLKIIRTYLLPESKLYEYIVDWNIDEVKTDDLMKDIMDSGALGDSSIDRLHTSNMTLHAVEGHKHNFVLKSLFPSVRKLRNQYTYLKKMPVLLPIAWVQRIYRYLKDNLFKKKSNATSSVKLGMERIDLLKEYRIIEK